MKNLGSMVRWIVLFRCRNKREGYHQSIVYRDGRFAMFTTRSKARAFARRELGYISRRADLRREPHGWLVPLVVRATITARRMTP